MSQIASYIKYRFKAKNRHGIHSPFVYKVLDKIVYAKSTGTDNDIENLRKDLLKNEELIHVQDLGAGSLRSKSNIRKIKTIAANSTSSVKVSCFLSRLISHFEYRNVLELGTNLGINTAYMAKACKDGKVVSIEGDPRLAELASQNLHKLKISNAEIKAGSFETCLLPSLEQLKKIDLAYIDGNHRLYPTIQYFETISNYCHNDSVIIIGDIHWSEEMEEAWNRITSSHICTISLDLFYLGLVFFRKEQVPQNFIIKF